MSLLLIQSLTAFFTTLISITILARIAPLVGLMDIPSSRKLHKGEIPLVGGLGIFMSLVVGYLLWGESQATMIGSSGSEALFIFLIAGGVLLIVGTLDDQFKLKVSLRVLAEFSVALIVIEGLDLNLRNLGALVGNDPIELPQAIAYPFTLIAIFGIINAFNMLDGMDGLLAALVLSSLLSFHIFTQTYPEFVSLFIGSSLFAFLISNLSLSKFVPHTFLGDAGSRLLGFIVVCLLLAAASSQVGSGKLIQPVTCLYVIALPLFDMVYTSVRRVFRKKSPFHADRSHIHHLMQDLGFSDRRALFIVVLLGSMVPSLGLLLNRLGASESLQFAIILGSFCTYCFLMNQAWHVADEINSRK